MPMVKITTNLSDREIPTDFIQAFGKVVADALSKPESRVLVELQTNLRMCRGGSCSGVVNVQIQSFEVFDEKRNPGYAQKIMPFLVESLGLPEDRVVLLFLPIRRTDVGSIVS